MSSITVRREISVGSIGGVTKKGIVVRIVETVVSCEISEAEKMTSCVNKSFLTERIIGSVFREAKIGRSMHSPQWSSFSTVVSEWSKS